MRLQAGDLSSNNGGVLHSPRSVAEFLSYSSSRRSWNSSACESFSPPNTFAEELKFLSFDQPSKTAEEDSVSHKEALPLQNLLKSVLPSADEGGLHQKLSELRIALDASNRAREESEKETESLRKYLSYVERGASSLHSRVQDLEQQLRFAEGDEEHDEMRDKMVHEALQEAQKQAEAAAEAVVVAREAAMELDKVKRHYFCVVKSQEEEITRLCKDLDNTRVLYQAKSSLAEPLRKRIRDLELCLHIQSQKLEAATGDKHNQVEPLQKDETKVSKINDASTTVISQRLNLLESEKLDLMVRNEFLEHQVNDLQRRQIIATIAHYDFELRKVRAVLGGEKAHLLSELALLRSRNKCLRGDLAEWHDKYMALSHHARVQPVEQNSVDNTYREHVKDTEALATELGRYTGRDKVDTVTKFDTANQDCSSCVTRDNILTAAHREIMKLNEINQWLLSACHNDIRLNKISRLL